MQQQRQRPVLRPGLLLLLHLLLGLVHPGRGAAHGPVRHLRQVNPQVAVTRAAEEGQQGRGVELQTAHHRFSQSQRKAG